jgi:hypothetical protein
MQRHGCETADKARRARGYARFTRANVTVAAPAAGYTGVPPTREPPLVRQTKLIMAHSIGQAVTAPVILRNFVEPV